MFIVRFFTGSILGVISGIVLLAIGLTVLFVAVVGALAVTGGASDCTPGDGPIVIDAAHSAAFKQKWDSFDARVDAGSPSSVNLTESEVSSRAETFLKENSTPLKEPRVCIHDGNGEAQAKISFIGLTAKFKVKGTVDLTGAHPKARVDSIDVGNVPGWLIRPAEAAVNRALDDALNDVKLDHRYAATLKAGEADVVETP